MKLIDYIRGDRRGKDANSFEMEAMDDPFLSDAIEGYDSVYGDHSDIVKRLEAWVEDRSVRNRQSRRRKLWGTLSAAAVVLAGAGIGLYMYNNRTPGTFTVAELLKDSPPAEEISMSRFRGDIPENSLIAYARTDTVSGSDTEGNAVDAEQGVSFIAAKSESRNVEPQAKLEKHVDEADVTVEVAAVSTADTKVRETVSGENEAVTLALAEEMNTAEVAQEISENDVNERLVTRSVLSTGEDVETVVYPVFDEYFKKNRRLKNDADGNPLKGEVVVEFRVNDAGVPSAVRIVSSFSREANREVLELLIEGPRWTPTHERRVRFTVKYE